MSARRASDNATRAPRAPSGGARQAASLAHIKLAVFDVDGVLTDGRIYYGARGEALKAFHVRDGHGFKLLQRVGVEIAIISGRKSAALRARMRELGVRHIAQGSRDKVADLEAIMAKLSLAPRDCACLVDDTVDLPLMATVGFAAAVCDAHPLVLRAAHWITPSSGGHGAARELCDAILRARGVSEPRTPRMSESRTGRAAKR